MAEQEELAFMGSQRREAIARAAVHVLAANGVSGLSMQAVAKQCAMPKSVVVYHVGDRQGLLTLAAEALLQSRHVLELPVFQVDGDPRQHLSAWLNLQFDAVEHADSPIRLVWVLQLDRESSFVKLAMPGVDKNLIYRLGQLLTRGHAQACWHAPDGLRAAAAVKAMTDGFLLQALANADRPDDVRKIRAACRGAVMDLLVR